MIAAHFLQKCAHFQMHLCRRHFFRGRAKKSCRGRAKSCRGRAKSRRGRAKSAAANVCPTSALEGYASIPSQSRSRAHVRSCCRPQKSQVPVCHLFLLHLYSFFSFHCVCRFERFVALPKKGTLRAARNCNSPPGHYAIPPQGTKQKPWETAPRKPVKRAAPKGGPLGAYFPRTTNRKNHKNDYPFQKKTFGHIFLRLASPAR